MVCFFARFELYSIRTGYRFRSPVCSEFLGAPAAVQNHTLQLEMSLAAWNTAEGTFFTALMQDITRRTWPEHALREGEQQRGQL